MDAQGMHIHDLGDRDKITAMRDPEGRRNSIAEKYHYFGSRWEASMLGFAGWHNRGISENSRQGPAGVANTITGSLIETHRDTRLVIRVSPPECNTECGGGRDSGMKGFRGSS
jgi:hypothetical protein